MPVIRVRCLLSLLSVVVCCDAYSVELIAHRGYTCRATENTLAAVSDAWRAKADGVELDLRVSRDGVIVVYHDETIGRRRISTMTYAEINVATDIDVPTLQSVLNRDAPRGYYVLDLKESSPERYRTLATVIRRSSIPPNRILIQGENVAVLTTLKSELPGATFHFLTRLTRRFPTFRIPSADAVLTEMAKAKLDGVTLKG
ncbi:MAG: glycerophosphodiester phosphodiesterase [Pseudomonadota bacterium]